MQPIGKTYLIKAIKKKDTSLVNGIYIPDDSSIHDIYYEGTILSYGTGWSKDELQKLIPIGTTIFFNYTSKSGTKLIIGDEILYIHDKDQILCVKENNND